MKKFLFSLILLLVSYVGFSQKGLSYQAVILDPAKIEVPGQDISGQPLVNGDVWMKFSIYNGSALQFEEVQKTQTDAYGLVNLLIGSVSATSFNSLVWDSSQKSLYVYVSFDQGGSYTKISDQKLNYNPYALFAETAGKLSGILAIGNGGTGATTLAEARVNLGVDKVDNTPDAAKPISAAVQAALDLKANSAEVSAGLDLKADKTDFAAALALKANAVDMTTALAAKADTGAIKAYVDTRLAAGNFTSTQSSTTATITDADASTKGKIQLAGDLAGTADAPTVPGLALKASATDVSSLTTIVDANTASITANTSDIALKAPIASPTFTGTVSGITKSMVGLGAVDNTTDAAKPISAATQTALDLKANTADLTSLTTTVNANTASITATAADITTLTTAVNSNTASITANTSDIALKANTTDVNTALALKAPLASPALSGVPTAPTASAGTNSTQIATTEFTNAAISSALSSTMFSVSTTLTSTITNPLGFIPSDNINFSGPLNVSTAQNLANGVDVLKGNQSGVANVGFGIANLFSNTTGTANTSVGYKGLYSNLSGKGNSAYGTYSLFNNTTGSSNTANGGQSLFSNTTGAGNTASGKFALFSNIGGTLNTATGYQALYANTVSNNTAYGAQSLYSNTTGTGNTASGAGALFLNTTGSDNTASGFLSLYTNSTGFGNTAIGAAALYNSTGSKNTANGNAALNFNSTGEKNTANGYYALLRNTTGSENTAIGQSAGSYIADGNTANTTSDYSVYLGSNTKASADDAQNEVVIGYNAIGGGSNTVKLGNTSVTKVITNGAITAGSVTYPNTDGSPNQVLSTNGSGTLTWTSAAGVPYTGATQAVDLGSYDLKVNGLTIGRGNGASSSNTAIGNQSLYTNSSGAGNTAIGYYSLKGNSSGASNTAIGSSALRFITSGQYNTALGSDAGTDLASNSDSNLPPFNATSNYSVYIGSNTKASNHNVSNEIVVGYGAIGGGSNTVTLGNTSVTKVITSGAITVGAGSSSIRGGLIVGAATSSVTSAVLEASSTTQGFLPPRMSVSQRDAISSKVAGLVVWCSNCGSNGELQVYNGTTWTNIIGGTASPAFEVGMAYQGGIIAYILQSGDPGYDANVKHGLIAATSDQSSGIIWGPNSTTGATDTAIGTGSANTDLIIASQGGTTAAAGLARAYTGGGYTDWYLPSKDELRLVFTAKSSIGGFSGYDEYWSSSEKSSSSAFIQQFYGSGLTPYTGKDVGFKVRAIRSF